MSGKLSRSTKSIENESVLLLIWKESNFRTCVISSKIMVFKYFLNKNYSIMIKGQQENSDLTWKTSSFIYYSSKFYATFCQRAKAAIRRHKREN